MDKVALAVCTKPNGDTGIACCKRDCDYQQVTKVLCCVGSLRYFPTCPLQYPDGCILSTDRIQATLDSVSAQVSRNWQIKVKTLKSSN